MLSVIRPSFIMLNAIKLLLNAIMFYAVMLNAALMCHCAR
jgi:hypothetical protein